jgi:spore coat polysaccharide biosynthesis protein SpsF
VKCFRGPLENVAERFLEVIKFYKPEVFVRISADSPLFDYRILEHGFSLWKEELDLLTTVGSGQPSGMNAEFVKSNTFCSTYNQFTVSNHFEHVTPYFYENAERFKIERLESAFSSSEKLKFSLDNHEDLKLIERIFEQMQRPHYTYTLEEKAELLRMAREVEPGR